MLPVEEIKKFIDEDKTSEKKRQAAEGQRYYNAEHDILKHRLCYFNTDGNLVEDKARSNIKISHPFFTELCDQLPAYLLSFKENPIRAKEKAEGLQDKLDVYFDDEFWAEMSDLLTGAYAKGFDYLYGYKHPENRIAFKYADGMGVVEAEAKYTSDGQDHIFYYYVDRVDSEGYKITHIQDWTKDEICFYTQSSRDNAIVFDDSVEINPRPHTVYTDEKTGQKSGLSFGYIPFWRLDNNRDQISGLKPIKGLIDDYDLMQCGLSNNLADFDTPLYVISGYPGEDLSEVQQNIKTKKIMGVDDGGNVDVKTVSIPYEARQAKAADDEKNIYRFGMGLNTSGLKDTTATTNLAIKAAYSLLDMKANKAEKRLKRLLKELLKVVLEEINAENETDYQITDIEFKFTRSILTNETENISNDKVKAEIKQLEVNTILNVAVNVGDEQTLKAICEVMDWDFEELQSELEKVQEPQNTANAKNALNQIEPETDPEPPTAVE